MTDTRTIRTEGYFGKEKHVTRKEYVLIWSNHAAELMKIGLNVFDEAKEKAGADWDRLYATQNPEEDEDEDLEPDEQELLNWGETDYDRRNDLR